LNKQQGTVLELSVDMQKISQILGTVTVYIQLTLDANYQTTSKFPQKDSSNGLRNLGARLAPDGNNNDENHQKTI